MSPLRQSSVDFHSYMSATAGVPSIALNPVDQEAKSLIILISAVQNHRPLRSELHPLLSSMKAVTPHPTPNWPQWMSITSLMAGMHPIHILLLEIHGHLV